MSSEEGSGEHSPLLSSMVVVSPTEAQQSAPGDIRRGTTWVTASLIIINATLGAGLLNFPAAYDAGGGILTAMIVQFILALLAGFSFILLAWLSDLRGSTTYQDTIGSVSGPFLKNLCAVLMILYTYASCVAYLIVVGDESDRVFSIHFGPTFCQHWYLNRKFIISIASIFLILPLCYAKKIDFLKYASGLATAGVVYFVFLTAYVFYAKPDTAEPVHVKTRPDRWTDVFKLIPSFCFAYQSHLSVVPTYACMDKRHLKQLTIAVTVAIVLSYIAYSVVGIYGYLTYGSSVMPDILSSFPVDNIPVAFGFFIFAIKVFLTYPVMEYVGREAVESFWIQCFKLDRVQVILGETRRRFWFATVWFFTSLMIGIFVPNILTVIGLLGSFAALFIFVFPGLCLLNSILILGEALEGDRIKKTAYFLSFLYITVGMFVFGLTIAQFFEEFSAPVKHLRRNLVYILRQDTVTC